MLSVGRCARHHMHGRDPGVQEPPASQRYPFWVSKACRMCPPTRVTVALVWPHPTTYNPERFELSFGFRAAEERCLVRVHGHQRRVSSSVEWLS
jgi:hypothetical protein